MSNSDKTSSAPPIHLIFTLVAHIEIMLYGLCRSRAVTFMAQRRVRIKCAISLGLSLALIALTMGCDRQNFSDEPLENLLLLDLSVSAACNDGVDNDQDGLIDFPDDPGCISEGDIDEVDVPHPTPCQDQVDNDNDGLVDFSDPGCELSQGQTEDVSPRSPQCSNGEDDDDDGYIDFPADESCIDAQSDNEAFIPEEVACLNLRDDDGDGLIDYPFDPGCASPQDQDERDEVEASMIAQCNDGVDNDQDGYTDLADTHCTTPTDARERRRDDEAIAVCSNGRDDDQDGLIDAWQDPGCIGPGGNSELDPDTPPACADGRDNDGDGYIDFPEEPGCASLGDPDESDPRVSPACLDGDDNDGDGLFDYPQDPGCDHAADTTEVGTCVSSAAVLELVSGSSYRGSSRQGRFVREGSCGGRGAPELTALYQVRQRVRSITFRTRGVDESGQAQEGGWETALYARTRCDEPQLEVACAREAVDGVAYNELTLEDPPLGPLYLLIDGATGRGGDFELSVEEVPIEACQNQIDDDGDGRVDFPDDPGCEAFIDEDETSPSPLPECADQVDNDADELIDYPLDIGCRAAFDDNELDECGQGVAVYPLDPPPSSGVGNTTREGVSSESVGSCGGLGIEKVIRYDNPGHAQLELTLSRLDGISERAFLYARAGTCLDSASELGCLATTIGGPPLEDEGGEDLPNPDGDDTPDHPEGAPRDDSSDAFELEPNPRHGASMTLRLESVPQGPVYLFIDHSLEGFPYRLIVKRVPLAPRCSDDMDNDGDGLIDSGDAGCTGPGDESELDPTASPACSDGRDNDIDGWTDYPLDVGCAYRGGDSEVDPEVLPSCSNEIDDDGDGYTDFPFDVGCAARGDDSEANLPEPPECVNLIDDDGDGLTDFPSDPGCVARGDRDEIDSGRRPQCNDGIDNDLNGVIDYPFDAGCYAAGDPREHPTTSRPQCSDELDNDLDGHIDIPYDPGCEAAGDESEVDPVVLPACANGIDDDNNGRIDWPDDPGCMMRADRREDAEGPLAPRCSDGVDNDDDGDLDLADIDCSSHLDPTEGPAAFGEEIWAAEARECADEVDNDADGLIDWPEDSGCAARGDACERGGSIRCDLDEVSDLGVCVDILSDPEHCGACRSPCAEGAQCLLGLCEGASRPLRSRLMSCGSSIRPLNEFLIGPLEGQEFMISAGCDPDDSVQALLITRTGGSGVALNIETIRQYLNGGGQLITERGISSRVVSEILNIPTRQGTFLGDCRSNIQPIVVSRRQDPLWSLTPHSPPSEDLSGCGYDLSALPGVIRLGGWDTLSTSLGYIEYGRGRVWLVESNWRDIRPEMSDESRALMAAMIAGGGKAIYAKNLPECMDLYDNDHDGFIDLFDPDCVSARDVTEQPRSYDEPPACADGVDNDDDGSIDFPFDPHCESAGDPDEREIAMPEGVVTDEILIAECADGLDNDQDGEIDWPYDAGCSGRGALRESHITALNPCNNQQDDDQDGRVDFPTDPECLARSWPSELSLARSRFVSQGVVIDRGREVNNGERFSYGCHNHADDDGDGLVDFPADPECLTPLDPDERGAQTDQSPEDRLQGFTFTLPECRDGLDNDTDGATDLNDLDCSGAQDAGPESGLDDASDLEPECGDLIDNDEDGAIDWPLDPDCVARGDLMEESLCAGLSAPSIVVGDTVTFNPVSDHLEDREVWDHLDGTGCADPSRVGKVYHLLQEESGPLRLLFSEHERTQSLVSVSVRRGCGSDAPVLLCQVLDLSGEARFRTLELPHLQRGEYLISVGAAMPPSWESWGRSIELPPDPRGYVSRDDITSICWQDGGQNSFDCMGRAEIISRDGALPLDVSLGTHNLLLEERYGVRYASEKPHPNIWRMRYWASGTPSDESQVTFRISGNLGLDHETIAIEDMMNIDGMLLPYVWFVDDLDAPTKPPVFFMVVPRDASELTELSTQVMGDVVEATTGELKLPLTTYLISSYLSRETLVAAIRADLDMYDGSIISPETPSEVTLQITD